MQMNTYRLLFSISKSITGPWIAFTNITNNENVIYLAKTGPEGQLKRLKKLI